MNRKQLLDYYDWADTRLSPVIAGLDKQDYTHSPADSTRSIKELMEHLVNSYDYLHIPYSELEDRMDWLATLDRTTLIKTWHDSRAKFIEAAMALEDKSYSFGEDTPEVDVDAYLLVHTDHITYHRGQIVHAIKSLGGTGVNTDFYSFLAI